MENKRPLKLLIATPAYGGVVTTAYLLGLLDAIRGLTEAGVEFEVLTLANESLIPRARNKCIDYALTRSFDKLLFIDADIEFRWSDVEKLLRSEKKIIGGVYPVKTLPIHYNFIPLAEDNAVFRWGKKGIEQFWKWKENALPTGEKEVQYVPTGFMLIDLVSVSRIPATKENKYAGQDVITGDRKQMVDYFPTGVRDGMYESEDWGFCSLVRSYGMSVWLHTGIVLKHHGTFAYGSYA